VFQFEIQFRIRTKVRRATFPPSAALVFFGRAAPALGRN
jgi:hypothetical protein